MENSETKYAIEQLLQDESLVRDLAPEDAKALLAWADAELSQQPPAGSRSPEERTKDVLAAVKEIRQLVSDKAALVSDDLEERMANLLVGDLDASSQVRLQIEREIAQVTAEKDHLDNSELLRQFTALASQAWQSKAAHAAQAMPPGLRHAATAQVKMQAIETDAPGTSTDPNEPERQSRPIPRPTPMPPKKSLLARILGR